MRCSHLFLLLACGLCCSCKKSTGQTRVAVSMSDAPALRYIHAHTFLNIVHFFFFGWCWQGLLQGMASSSEKECKLAFDALCKSFYTSWDKTHCLLKRILSQKLHCSVRVSPKLQQGAWRTLPGCPKTAHMQNGCFARLGPWSETKACNTVLVSLRNHTHSLLIQCIEVGRSNPIWKFILICAVSSY